MPSVVHFDDTYPNMLVKMYNLCGVANKVVGKLRYVDKPVLMHAYVDECTKIYYISDGAC